MQRIDINHHLSVGANCDLEKTRLLRGRFDQGMRLRGEVFFLTSPPKLRGELRGEVFKVLCVTQFTM